MRLLFIADGRSPIALNWIRHFSETGHEVHLLSTFPCKVEIPLESLSFVSVAFSGQSTSIKSSPTHRAMGDAKGIGLRTAIRHWFGPFTILAAARQVRSSIEALEPDLIHAMRIPFEGMLAAAIDYPAPLLLSVWGNDFTLHAPASPWMRNLTRRALFCADALHVDCRRDQRLAKEWGFAPERPVKVLPGAGGIRRDIFYTVNYAAKPLVPMLPDGVGEIPEDTLVVVNPRGFRAYIRNDTFFKAIPIILSEYPKTLFLCPAMKDEQRAERWLNRFDIHHAVRLLPKLEQHEMASVFRRAHIAVSLSEHDGTPNTLLEALACGSFPVAGDLESIREWIEDGENGLLVDPGEPEEVANAVLRAGTDRDVLEHAQAKNDRIIEERASYHWVMRQAEEFYAALVGEAPSP
jgi:glycosyltransferase involved in cell wall biosynthesis